MDASLLILISGICIACAAICRVFDCGAREYGVVLKTAAAASVLIAVISAAEPVFSSVNEIFSKTGADSEYLKIMIKAAGICYLTRLASDICTDSGESTLASQAELAGKISLIVLGLPLFEKTIAVITPLIY
ncbi:MAG: SpoIIIAC/SpoIIIAD family protein [Huintestinicola sp.]